MYRSRIMNTRRRTRNSTSVQMTVQSVSSEGISLSTTTTSPSTLNGNLDKPSNTLASVHSLNRPESRNSQHSSISVASTSVPVSRTTTSRRGGKVSRSRSPLSYSNRDNERKSCTPIRGYRASPPPTIIPSTTPRQRKEPASEGRVSSVAAKAAAEAQRLWLHARASGKYGQGHIESHQSDQMFWDRNHLFKTEMNLNSKATTHRVQIREGGNTEKDDHQNVFRRQIDTPQKSQNEMSMLDNRTKKSDVIETRSSNRVKKPCIMGSATPLHVPRANPDITLLPKQKPSSQNISSSEPPPYEDDLAPPGSPQRLLLDLKSGSKSFELEGPTHPLSPQEPPQIQHSHQQINPDSFFFEPQKSPRTPKTPKSPGFSIRHSNTMLGTPSFNLFHHDFDAFDENDNFHLPTPNPNSNCLLDSDLRSPVLSPVQGIDGCSPRKELLMNSPFLEGFDSAFSPKQGSKLKFNETDIKEVTIEGAPPMPQVSSGERSKGADRMKTTVLEFKSASHRPPKKRIFEQEKTSPNRMMKSESVIENDVRIHREKKQEKSSRQISNGRMNSYRSQMPQSYHPKYLLQKMSNTRVPTLAGMKAPHLYQRLSCHSDAFSNFTFLLPGFHSIIKKKETSSDTAKHSKKDLSKETKNNSDVARRRVTSAVFAFGGNCDPIGNTEEKIDNISKASIFRVKVEDDNEEKESNNVSKYEASLSGRYYENENRISWEAEEDPPVEIPSMSIALSTNSDGSPSIKRKSSSNTLDDKTLLKKSKVEEIEEIQSTNQTSDGGDQPKMRYRCKLCGQPKQNHTCPYQQSLQRSIGIMVYPAVNSYTALEPGYLAPALSEMNNFINGSEMMNMTESTPSRPSPLPHMMNTSFAAPSPSMVLPLGTPHNVTPESIRNGQTSRLHGDSSDSVPSPEIVAPRTPFSRPPPYGRYPMTMLCRPTPIRVRRKGILAPEASVAMSRDSHWDALFMEKTDLRQEQYRIVSLSSKSPSAYKYPSLPLPYTQRKSLSDNLFALSKEVPHLTDECAAVLRQAREQDKWDLAVAELLTQVIVVIHCPEEDSKLDGLSKYLLTLGFAC